MNQEPNLASTRMLLAVLAAFGLASSALAQDDPFADEGPVDETDSAEESEPEPEELNAPSEEEEPASSGFSLSGSASTEDGAEGSAEAAGPTVEAADENVGDDVEEIVVTGSRIKRTTYSLPSAVQVVSRKELEMSGATNMSDVVKHMSANSGSSFNPDVVSATTNENISSGRIALLLDPDIL